MANEDLNQAILQSLGIPIRKPYQSENMFFQSNPNVGGMAAEDNQIILNPYSTLTPEEKNSVALNEAYRVHQRQLLNQPNIPLTQEQQSRFAGYGNQNDILSTLISRHLSGDPSSGTLTAEQNLYAAKLRDLVNLRDNGLSEAIASNQNYGLRTDLTPKANGYFGPLKRPDGEVSTELSTTVGFNGKETLIPLLVPTLDQSEINHLLGGGETTQPIIKKAVDFARFRMSQGLSPFAGNEEIPYGIKQ